MYIQHTRAVKNHEMFETNGYEFPCLFIYLFYLFVFLFLFFFFE